MNISLLMHGIQEGTIEEKHYEKLKIICIVLK